MTKAYGFESDGRTVIVAWRKEGAAAEEISLGGKLWHAMDLLGNDLNADTVILTERPVYFVAEDTNLNKLPW